MERGSYLNKQRVLSSFAMVKQGEVKNKLNKNIFIKIKLDL